jgi:hypothetical protein
MYVLCAPCECRALDLASLWAPSMDPPASAVHLSQMEVQAHRLSSAEPSSAHFPAPSGRKSTVSSSTGNGAHTSPTQVHRSSIPLLPMRDGAGSSSSPRNGVWKDAGPPQALMPSSPSNSAPNSLTSNPLSSTPFESVQPGDPESYKSADVYWSCIKAMDERVLQSLWGLVPAMQLQHVVDMIAPTQVSVAVGDAVSISPESSKRSIKYQIQVLRQRMQSEINANTKLGRVLQKKDSKDVLATGDEPSQDSSGASDFCCPCCDGHLPLCNCTPYFQKAGDALPQHDVGPAMSLQQELLYFFFTYWSAFLEFSARFDVEGQFKMAAAELASGFHLLGLEVDVFEIEQVATEAKIKFAMHDESETAKDRGAGSIRPLTVPGHQQSTGRISITVFDSDNDVKADRRAVFNGFIRYVYILSRIFDSRSNALAERPGAASVNERSFAWSSCFYYLMNLCIFPVVAHAGMRLVHSTAAREPIITFRGLMLCFSREYLLTAKGAISPFQSRVLMQFRFLCNLLRLDFLLEPGWYPLRACRNDSSDAGKPSGLSRGSEEARSFFIGLFLDCMWLLLVLQPILFFALHGYATIPEPKGAYDAQCLTNVEGFLPAVLNWALAICVCAILSVPALRSSEQWRRITDEDGLRQLRLKNAKLYHLTPPVHEEVAPAGASQELTEQQRQERQRLVASSSQMRSVPLPHAEALIVMMEQNVNQRLAQESAKLQDNPARVVLRYLACYVIALAPAIVRAIHGQSFFCTSANGDGDHSVKGETFLVVGSIFVVVFGVRLIILQMISIRTALFARLLRMEIFSELLYPAVHIRDRTRRHGHAPESAGRKSSQADKASAARRGEDEEEDGEEQEEHSEDSDTEDQSASPSSPLAAAQALTASLASSGQPKHTLRNLMDSYLAEELQHAKEGLFSSLSIRFRCYQPANCISWWNLRVYISSVKGHEVTRMEIFLSLLVLLLLGCVAAPIAVLLLQGNASTVNVQATTASAVLLMIIIAGFLARVLLMAVQLNEMAVEHTTILKQEMVSVLFEKTIRSEKARRREAKAKRAWEAMQLARRDVDATTAPAVFPSNLPDLSYIDVSLQLLESMVQSLEKDPGCFRLLGVTLNKTLLNSLFSFVASGVVALVTILISEAKASLESSNHA